MGWGVGVAVGTGVGVGVGVGIGVSVGWGVGAGTSVGIAVGSGVTSSLAGPKSKPAKNGISLDNSAAGFTRNTKANTARPNIANVARAITNLFRRKKPGCL